MADAGRHRLEPRAEFPAALAARGRTFPAEAGRGGDAWAIACGIVSAMEGNRGMQIPAIFSASQSPLRSQPASRIVRAKFAFAMKRGPLRATPSAPGR